MKNKECVPRTNIQLSKFQLYINSYWCLISINHKLMLYSNAVSALPNNRTISVSPGQFGNSGFHCIYSPNDYWRSIHNIINIGKIRNLLSYNACSTIIYALISCRSDYCNSLLYNVPTHKNGSTENTSESMRASIDKSIAA